MAEANQTVIVVEGGAITQIFSTIPADDHIIEIIDVDGAGQESPEEKEATEARIDELSNDPEYRDVLKI